MALEDDINSVAARADALKKKAEEARQKLDEAERIENENKSRLGAPPSSYF